MAVIEEKSPISLRMKKDGLLFGFVRRSKRTGPAWWRLGAPHSNLISCDA